jgi:hypothetical protein
VRTSKAWLPALRFGVLSLVLPFTLAVGCGEMVYAFSPQVIVVVEGIGDSPNSAANNAANNALKKITGTYIDTETIYERKVATKDGKRTEEKETTTETREYAKGVIKDVEILSVSNEDGFYRVIAQITVRLIREAK